MSLDSCGGISLTPSDRARRAAGSGRAGPRCGRAIRPAASSRKGSGPSTSVQPAGIERTRSSPGLAEEDPVVAPAVGVADQLELPAAQWVERMGDTETSFTSRTACSRRPISKGKVERANREVKADFLAWLGGQVLPERPTLGWYDAAARRWATEVVAKRRHRTTERIVGEAWTEERPLLLPVSPPCHRPLRGRRHPRGAAGWCASGPDAARARGRDRRDPVPRRLCGAGPVSRASEARTATAYARLREHLADLGLATRLGAARRRAGAGLEEDGLGPGRGHGAAPRRRGGGDRGPPAGGRLRFAHYPLEKRLADFELDFQPSIDRAVIAELSTLRFVEERRNVLLLGPPGVGKSHVAIALGIAATEAGYRTYFTTAADLVAALTSAHLEGSWSAKMRTYTGPSVLVIDELGCAPRGAISPGGQRGPPPAAATAGRSWGQSDS